MTIESVQGVFFSVDITGGCYEISGDSGRDAPL